MHVMEKCSDMFNELVTDNNPECFKTTLYAMILALSQIKVKDWKAPFLLYENFEYGHLVEKSTLSAYINMLVMKTAPYD